MEGDITRKIKALFWEKLTHGYDFLLPEKNWLPEFVMQCPLGEMVILPAFSDLVPESVKQSYAQEWALALAPAFYRYHVGWYDESPYHKIPLKSVPQLQRQYPIKHEPKMQIREILEQLEYQGG